MALEAGTRLGPYEVLSGIGAGGMGEVYRAKDTRLERTVAIKVLNSALIASPELKARFDREAKVISQLQHPNICVLHDVGSENGTDFLVMEFLEGESLAERLRKGPLSAQDLLNIAIEIADALEKAHRAGVVHRDLKPGNVMLTKAGAKLLDFGLAKPFAAGASATAGSGSSASVFAAAMTQTSPAHSPGSPLSTAGALIGTVQYMSPEQIQGVEADARSDIFAFGVMLFEMATGKRAFEGKTQASIVGQILAVDPPSVSTLRPETPPGLDRVIRICLDKDPDERVQTVHDLKLELQRIAESAAIVPAAAPVVAPARQPWLLWIVAAVLAIAVIALGVWYVQMLRVPQVSVHSYVLPPGKSEFNFLANWAGPAVVSPDGRRIAFIAKKPISGEDVLWVQPLNSPTAQPMAGTENAGYPFWSYDSRYVGFFANGKLEKIDANGGPPQVLCDASSGRGGTWNQDDVILFTPSTGTGLSKVSAAGGVPAQVLTLDTKAGEISQRWPEFLPDGKHFLFWIQLSGSTAGGGIYSGSLDSPEHKLLVTTGSSGAYAEPGYLLFVRDGALMAQRLNTRKLQLEGDATPIADHVAVNTSTYRSVFTVSRTGNLLYLGSGETSGSHLNWFGVDGKQTGAAVAEAGLYYQPALSPDGKRLAAGIESGATMDIWVVDLQRHTKTRLTFGPGRSSWPVWSPDGRWIYYSNNGGGADNHIYRRPADGTGNSESVVVTEGVTEIPSAITADGKYLSYFLQERKVSNGFDVYALPLFGDKKPIPQVTTKFNEVVPRFSPDGKWLAYMSNETGQMEVYVKPFPGESGKYQVSTSGGATPRWRADSRELYFVKNDTIMAVDVRVNASALELGTPRELIKVPMAPSPIGPYDVSADGKKFLVNQLGEAKVLAPLTLVTNWTADLKK
jgi:serine/threonine protein kinase/Tol biopolymer transport system component